MAKEVTIKELLERAGVDADSERYQELASYIAAHAVYAVDLTGDASEAITSQTHIICKPNARLKNQTQKNIDISGFTDHCQTQIERKIKNSNAIRGGISDDQNQNLPDFRFVRRCPGAIQRSQLRDDALSAYVDLHFEDGKR